MRWNQTKLCLYHRISLEIVGAERIVTLRHLVSMRMVA